MGQPPVQVHVTLPSGAEKTGSLSMNRHKHVAVTNINKGGNILLALWH